jgi:hypothetical protein
MSGTTVPDTLGHVPRDNGTGQPAPFRGLSPCLVPWQWNRREFGKRESKESADQAEGLWLKP